MGSYCALKFDEIEIFDVKSVVPDDFVALFQESDRVVRKVPETEEDDSTTDIFYQASRDVILTRLALLGCTEGVVRDKFEEWKKNQKKSLAEYVEYSGDEDGDQKLKVINEFDFDVWRERGAALLAMGWDKLPEEPVDEIDRHLRDNYDGWLHFAGYGSLVTVRALLDAFPTVKHVTLDISDLVGGGYIGGEEPICGDRRKTNHGEIRNLAPTVILAEGSTDIQILERSLATLYPEVRDYFSFFDHRELSVDGGTSYLVKFLKAFAAARAPLHIVAVFDNDAAGIHAYTQTNALTLPSNIKALCLPDIKLAEKYPTVGPQGDGVANVNGRAASIELYLGRHSLNDERGNLRPVRWTGYVPPIKTYQGEVECKAEIQARFFKSIANVANSTAARNAFPELTQVWQAILKVVERSMSEARRNEVLDTFE
jgi:hypothetical protein